MRVAICDAEREALEALRIMVSGSDLVNQIHGFLSLEEIWDAMEAGQHFDLVFLQIEWNRPQNGIDFAADLMKASPNTQIIYVAGENARFAQQIFLKPANICGYLVKPVERDLLDKLLEKAWHAAEEWEEKKLVVRQKGILHAIPLRKICYLESRGHQVLIHTTKDKILCYDRLENMKERLPEHFQQCHKSYLVNFDNVRIIERSRLILKTEEEIPISRARYAQAKAAYVRYAGKTLGDTMQEASESKMEEMPGREDTPRE